MRNASGTVEPAFRLVNKDNAREPHRRAKRHQPLHGKATSETGVIGNAEAAAIQGAIDHFADAKGEAQHWEVESMEPNFGGAEAEDVLTDGTAWTVDGTAISAAQ